MSAAHPEGGVCPCLRSPRGCSVSDANIKNQEKNKQYCDYMWGQW